MNNTIIAVTEDIIERSKPTREAYLSAVAENMRSGPRRVPLSAANMAHATAGCPVHDKMQMLGSGWPNIGIVTAYNDMLSAHQPFERFPEIIRQACRDVGATAQVAGGVPAMCDGVTQGRDGMELSLLSRDVIAMGTAVALSHDAYDAAIYLGVCDKIVPGLLIGALRYGYLPAIFAPAGPMPSGISNPEKAKIRQLFAEGKVGREELQKAESASYHSPGTCTFYGTANSNQMLMEIMGLQLPGSSFVHPNTPLRDAITRRTAQRAVEITDIKGDHTPIADVIDERAIVNGLVGLMATGGSTNLTIHMSAIARAAGILINWDDYARISGSVPLICKIYPNGPADVNHFHAAGGMAYLTRQLIDAGLVHADVTTIAGEGGLEAYTKEPKLDGETIAMVDGPAVSRDTDIARSVAEPFRTDGGLALMQGDLGRGVMKVSAVAPENWFVEAPAICIDHQDQLWDMFDAGKLAHDFVVVLRFQGPSANGMPELHKLSAILGSLQDKGFSVGMVTDGRMSGASGKFPAAIHFHPEAAHGGPIARVRDGDIVRLDPAKGTVTVPGVDLSSRDLAPAPEETNQGTLGMNMFAPMRGLATDAESGASILGVLA